jgi:coenzyme Q-binding protein COQ10
MPQFETTHRVAHSAQEMFDLVADVEAYPQFVPLCERLVVRARREEVGRQVLVADMTIGYKVIHETFTSQVTLDRLALLIRADYLDGPFRFMENRWTFVPVGEGQSDIGFHIAYEFKSRAFSMLMGAMFDRVFRTYSDAFEKRADVIYAKVQPAGEAKP